MKWLLLLLFFIIGCSSIQKEEDIIYNNFEYEIELICNGTKNIKEKKWIKDREPYGKVLKITCKNEKSFKMYYLKRFNKTVWEKD